MKPENRPKFRPLETQTGIEIMLDSSEGIPLPENSKTFDRGDVLKRVVRVGIFGKVKRDYVGNVCQIPAEWQQGAPGKWTFK